MRQKIITNACPDCGEPIDKIAQFCKKCKRKRYNAWRRDNRRGLGKTCPDCGKVISNTATYCSKHSQQHRPPGNGYKIHEIKLKNGSYDPIGTEKTDQRGYVWIKVSHGKSHEKGISGRYGNFAPKHRYVMEQHLGRLLTRKEAVHHIDGNKSNNHIDNLLLISNTNHNKINYFLALIEALPEEDRQKVARTITSRYPELFC